jgi:hypothetical protein
MVGVSVLRKILIELYMGDLAGFVHNVFQGC